MWFLTNGALELWGRWAMLVALMGEQETFPGKHFFTDGTSKHSLTGQMIRQSLLLLKFLSAPAEVSPYLEVG